jgi:hypothetical protein
MRLPTISGDFLRLNFMIEIICSECAAAGRIPPRDGDIAIIKKIPQEMEEMRLIITGEVP